MANVIYLGMLHMVYEGQEICNGFHYLTNGEDELETPSVAQNTNFAQAFSETVLPAVLAILPDTLSASHLAVFRWGSTGLVNQLAGWTYALDGNGGVNGATTPGQGHTVVFKKHVTPGLSLRPGGVIPTDGKWEFGPLHDTAFQNNNRMDPAIVISAPYETLRDVLTYVLSTGEMDTTYTPVLVSHTNDHVRYATIEGYSGIYAVSTRSETGFRRSRTR